MAWLCECGKIFDTHSSLTAHQEKVPETGHAFARRLA